MEPGGTTWKAEEGWGHADRVNKSPHRQRRQYNVPPRRTPPAGPVPADLERFGPGPCHPHAPEARLRPSPGLLRPCNGRSSWARIVIQNSNPRKTGAIMRVALCVRSPEINLKTYYFGALPEERVPLRSRLPPPPLWAGVEAAASPASDHPPAACARPSACDAAPRPGPGRRRRKAREAQTKTMVAQNPKSGSGRDRQILMRTTFQLYSLWRRIEQPY